MTSTPSTTDIDLDAMQRLCDGATAGEWYISPGGFWSITNEGDIEIAAPDPEDSTPWLVAVAKAACNDQTEANAAFIAGFNPVTASALIAKCREQEKEIERLRRGAAKSNEEVCQVLGKALGYPWFKDDPGNFPDATEADGVCVGDHVAESLAAEAAQQLAAAPDEMLADEVEHGRKLLAVYDALFNCSGSLRAVLPLLEEIQAHCPPGDHDVTIARAKHNLDVLDKEIVKQDTPAIIAHLRRPQQPADWRPIAEAPKDGTPCLMFSPGNHRAFNENARYPYYRVDRFSEKWPRAQHQYPEAPYTRFMLIPAPPAEENGK